MDRWQGKVAVVTGASAGIGAAIALELCLHGVTVCGWARRKERIDELRQQLPTAARARLHAVRCDMASEADIVAAMEWTCRQLGGVDILVNNAGCLRSGVALLDAGNTAALRETMDVNVMGVALATREAMLSMRQRRVTAGHIVLINSVAGHRVAYMVGQRGSENLYHSSKHAVTAMTEVLRQELQELGSPVKVTSINPGVVRTELHPPDGEVMRISDQVLLAKDVADACMYVLGTPAHVQIHDLTIKPMGEKFL